MYYLRKSLQLILLFSLITTILLFPTNRADAQNRSDTNIVLAAEPGYFNFTLNPGDSIIGESLYVYEITGSSINFWLYNYSSWLEVDTMSASPLYTPEIIFLHIRAGMLEPGIYSDTVLIMASEAINSPLLIPITLTVEGNHEGYVVETTPTYLRFTSNYGTVAYDSLYVYEADSQAVGFMFYNTCSWLTVDAPGIPPYMTPTSLLVTANSNGLAPGVYYDSIFINPDVDSSAFPPVIVPVGFAVLPAESFIVRAAPDHFQFNLNAGEILNNIGMLVYEENGESVLFAAEVILGSNWLQLHPPDTIWNDPWHTPDSLYFDINTNGLEPGVYGDTIVIYYPLDDSLWFEDVKVPVVIIVEGNYDYVVETSPSWFHFYLDPGESGADSLIVYEIYDRPVPFHFTYSAPWINVTIYPPGSPHITPKTLGVYVYSDSLDAGTYTDTIFIFPDTDGVSFAPVAVPIMLTVQSQSPFIVHALPEYFEFTLHPGENLSNLGMWVYEENGGSVPFITETTHGSWLHMQTPDTSAGYWLQFTPDSVYFNITTNGLNPGIYTDTIIIYNPFDTLWFEDIIVLVRLTVLSDDTTGYIVETYPTSFNLFLDQGDSFSDSLFIYEFYGRQAKFYYNFYHPWLSVIPFGEPPFYTPTTLNVLIETDSLDPGVYIDTIFIFPDTGWVSFPTIAVTVFLTVGAENDSTCGDANGDGDIDILDILYLIKYIYLDGPPPNPPTCGDVNSDDNTNLTDIIILIEFRYMNGMALDCP